MSQVTDARLDFIIDIADTYAKDHGIDSDFDIAQALLEFKALRAALREAKPAILMAVNSLHEDARRWQEHNGNPEGFAKECRDDAAQLRVLGELVKP